MRRHPRFEHASSALFGPGLLDARSAEMLHTFAGGCHDQSDAPPGAPAELVGTPGPNDCAELQISVHSP